MSCPPPPRPMITRANSMIASPRRATSREAGWGRHCRGDAGGVGRGIQFRVNLRRPAIVDGGPATEHEDRRDERIHHRDIAAAVPQQAIKTECRHGDDPTFCRGARVWVKTVRLG